MFGQTAAVISASSSQHVVVLLKSALAVKFATRMQLRLNTVAEAAGLFNLHPMAVINLHCIPTLLLPADHREICSTSAGTTIAGRPARSSTPDAAA